MARMTILLTLLLLCVIMGCSDPIREGRVVSKWYEPEETWLQPIAQYRYDPTLKMNVFSHYIYVPQVDDEDFMITIEDDVEGKIRSRTVELNESRWESIEVGDWISLDEEGW